MSLFMRLTRSLKSFAKRTLRDLFSEEGDAPSGAIDETRLFEIRTRLDGLLPVLAQLSQDERKTADEYRQALAENERLDGEIRSARAAEDEEHAKGLIDEQWRVRELADEREERCNQLAETREAILSEMQKLHQLLDSALEGARKQDSLGRYRQALEEIEKLEKEVRRAAGNDS